ncbi:MAG: SprT family zinc-dependent metalloprotease [Eubacteriales bacterium]|nr:SprT family zinc-dependent metalloprotease [Eubacteriales bacterium]
MEVTVIRSDRRTVSIRVNSDLSVTVRAPRWLSKKEIDRILIEKEGWINRHIEQIRQLNEKDAESGIRKLSDEDIRRLRELAYPVISERVRHFSEIIGVDYGSITIRNQKTRWGSCSGNGNLSFNCLLMLAPPDVLDYVVVHELCHRKEMNHSKRFWDEVEKVLPDYRKQRRWLKEEGIMLIRELRIAESLKI